MMDRKKIKDWLNRCINDLDRALGKLLGIKETYEQANHPEYAQAVEGIMIAILQIEEIIKDFLTKV